MNLFGLNIPLWVFDWSGSICVVVSLWYLFTKHIAYWHWSNISLVPYFVLFLVGREYMLAGLQVSYLIFGIHGLWLWTLEHRRDHTASAFNERFWYNLGWQLTLVIFAYTVYATSFVDGWAWWQFWIVAASLVANWATTRKWIWSWYLWLVVNAAQAFYFWHLHLHAQFGLQFVLFAMSVYGLRRWQADKRAAILEPDLAFLPGEEAGVVI